jgi:hypothetical protein
VRQSQPTTVFVSNRCSVLLSGDPWFRLSVIRVCLHSCRLLTAFDCDHVHSILERLATVTDASERASLKLRFKKAEKYMFEGVSEYQRGRL